ncbi:galectin-3 [Rhipicephalus sanguineus]|uniref:galectin-3 n=1 Tax=Rhipicephalus sanguineus TaxID=34632 RepID=UPI0018942E53|nr:galectin-3 [Rhipicephalus sanguineus]
MLTRFCAFLLAIATTASGTLHCHLLKSGGGAAGRPFLGTSLPGGFKGGLGGGGYSGFRSDFQSGGFAPAGFVPGPGGFGVGPAVAGGFSPGAPAGFGPSLPIPLTLSRPPAVTFIPGGQTKVILVKVKHLGTTTHHPTGFNGGPAQGGPLLGPLPFGLPSSAGYGAPLKSARGGWW